MIAMVLAGVALCGVVGLLLLLLEEPQRRR
jgi:hypothetical protein